VDADSLTLACVLQMFVNEKNEAVDSWATVNGRARGLKAVQKCLARILEAIEEKKSNKWKLLE